MSQTISEAYANLLLSNEFIGTKIPLVQVVISDGVTEYEITKVSSFNMSREFGAIAQSVTIQIPNVDPDDPLDTGYYNAQRNMTAHGKAATAYKDLIRPGRDLYIKAGYGDDNIADTVKIITANIDTVKVKISGEGESVLEILARCTGKYLVDGTIQQYNTSTGIINYYITYPIAANIQTHYLGAGDLDPYLYQIWVDACMRAGYDVLNIGGDWASFTMTLSDCDADAFKEITGKWCDLAKKIADLLGAYMYEDEEGNIWLKVANDLEYADTESITLTGTTGVALSCRGYNYRAIEDSIEVSGYTRSDWDFDYASNKIRRTSTSTIPSGTTVTVLYTFCAWCYKPNQIFDLTQWTSHDEVYGRLVMTNKELQIYATDDLGTLGDGSTVSTIKTLVEDHPELTTEEQLTALVALKKAEMLKNYFNMSADVVAIPHLRVRDTICTLLYGTISSIYEITGFNLSYDPESGFTQQIEGIYYNTSGVY